MTLDSSRLEVGSTFSRARLATIVGHLSFEPPGVDSSDQVINIDGQWQFGEPATAPDYEGQIYFYHGNGGADDFVTMYVAVKVGEYPTPPAQLPPFRFNFQEYVPNASGQAYRGTYNGFPELTLDNVDADGINHDADYIASDAQRNILVVAMSKTPSDLEQFAIPDWGSYLGNLGAVNASAKILFDVDSPGAYFLESLAFGDDLYIATEAWGNNEPYPEGPILEWAPVSQGGEITDPRTGEPKDPLYNFYGLT